MHDAAQLPETLQAELAPDLSPLEIQALEEAVFAEEPREFKPRVCVCTTYAHRHMLTAAGLGMRAPSSALTGWVTARMLAEASCVAGAGKGPGTPPLAPSAWPGGVPGPATRLAGASHLPPAAAQLHVDLTLKERLAALSSRRDERDKTFLALRRRYVHELRCFLLERQEQDDALSACATNVRAVRATGPAAVSGVHPHGSQPSGATSPGADGSDSQGTPNGSVSRRSSRRAAAASQQEEGAVEDDEGDSAMHGMSQTTAATPVVASVHKASGTAHEDEALDADPLKMTERAHASAIAAQNVQLRARLSLLTQRLTAEWKDALVAGAVRPPTGPGDEPGQGKALAAAHAAAITAACSPQGGSGAEGVHEPSSSFYDVDKGLVFASGDIVRCDLGDGLVVGQNDVTGMCCVRLTWGAVVFCPSDQLLLLALAGEDSTTPRRLAHGAAMDKQASLRGGQYGFGGSLLDGAHGEPCDSMHAQDEESALAAQLTTQVQAAVDASEEEDTLAGVPCFGEQGLLNDVRDARKPVFRISWDARVPRGVPLRLNPARGLACNGYATGAATQTFDGSGDAGMPGAAYGVSWHPADADVFLADGGRARRGQKASAGPAAGSSFALGQHSSGGFSLVPVPEGGLAAQRTEGVSTPSQRRSALGGVGDSEPPTLVSVGGSAGGVGSADMGGGGGDSSLAQSPMAAHPWGAMSPVTPGGGVSATATKAHMAQSRAEVQRLKYQLRTAEEARRDQRRRLTDSRQSVTYLLAQLGRARSALSAQSEDLSRREGQVAELAGQVERMTHRYSEAVRRAWVAGHPEDATSPASDDSGADDEEEGSEEDDGGMGSEDDAAGSEEDEEGASVDERRQDADGAAADAMAALAGAAGAAFGGRKRPREEDDEADTQATAGVDDEEAVQQLATMAAALQGSTSLGDDEDSTPAAAEGGVAPDAEGGYIAPMAFAPTGPRPGDGVTLSALSSEDFDAEMGAPAKDGRTRSLRLRLQGNGNADSAPLKVQVLPANAAVRMNQHKSDKSIMAAIQALPLPPGAELEGAGEGTQPEDGAAGQSQSHTESVDGGAAGSTSTREETTERRGGARRRRRSAR